MEMVLYISIHILRGEDDEFENPAPELLSIFQSTSPGWRTTDGQNVLHATLYISIHVPRVEDDDIFVAFQLNSMNFNPRPPGGGRRTSSRLRAQSLAFQSTSPGWRTTLWLKYLFCVGHISIHVPRVEDDVNLLRADTAVEQFQSTSPGWRTTFFLAISSASSRISIHVPRVEDDFPNGIGASDECISIHVPRVEDDVGEGGAARKRFIISIHVPRVEDDGILQYLFAIFLIFQSTSPRVEDDLGRWIGLWRWL